MSSWQTRALVAALRGVSVSSRLIGPPKGMCRQTSEWFATSRYARSATLHEVIEPCIVGRELPGTLDGRVPWPFLALYGGTVARDRGGWIAHIPLGRVVGDGAVITPDDRLLADVSRELFAGDQANHSVLRRWRLPRVRRAAGRVAVLSAAALNYWHWFCDVLPRALLLSKDEGLFASVDTFIINRPRMPYQFETLERLGIPPAKVLPSDPVDLHVEADVLIVPSLFAYVPARWACEGLRERLHRRDDGASGMRRIYISRTDARTRRVVNEDVLLRRLARLGVEPVILTGRSLRAQIQLFTSAELVVAPHGAGLTNVLFCRPRTKVVELFSPAYVNPLYWVVGSHLGLEYFAAIGAGEAIPPPPPNAEAHEWFWAGVRRLDGHAADFAVDVDEVALLVERAVASQGHVG